MSTTESAQPQPMDLVRSLADKLVEEAGRKAVDGATIDFLAGKVKRVEGALSKLRERLSKEFSHHARYNEQKDETWKLMRELGKGSEAEIDEVKAQVRARANPEAKAFYEKEALAEAARVEQEKEYEELHAKKCAELRGTARETCAAGFMDEASTAKYAQDLSMRKRKANGVTDPMANSDGEQSDDESAEKPRKKAAKDSGNDDKKAEAAKKAVAAKKAAELAEAKARAAGKVADAAASKASKAADAEPHPGTLGIKAPAVSRPKGGKAAAPAKKPAPAPSKKPAPTISKKPAAAKKPVAATKPPKGQRKPKNAYQLWMGAQTTKQRWNEERQKAVDALKDDEELPDRFKSQREWYPEAWKQVSDAEHARFKREAEEEKKQWAATGGAPAAAASSTNKGKKAPPAREPEPEDSGSNSDASDDADADADADADKHSPANSDASGDEDGQAGEGEEGAEGDDDDNDEAGDEADEGAPGGAEAEAEAGAEADSDEDDDLSASK